MLSPTSGDRKRLIFVALFIFGLFSVLIIQFYKIQILEGDKWTKAANAQHRTIVTEPFQRGIFYSNSAVKQGHPEEPRAFVVPVPYFHLYADPSAIHEDCRAEIIQALSKAFDVDKIKLKSNLEKKSRNRKLIMWLTREDRDRVLKWWFQYAKAKKMERNALYFVQDYKRSHPFGKSLGQVLHAVREDGAIPTGGLELAYNHLLQGKNGKRMIYRSPRHPLDMGKVISQPENGADIYLTVNHYIQAIAEEEIEKAVKNSNSKAGWAIVMHPRTGEILALAQYPFFEPDVYNEYFNDPKKKENTKVKAVTDAYEPGSTIKPLTIAICLLANKELQKRGQKPLFYSDEKIETRNGKFPGRSGILKDTHTHNFLNLNMGMQKSSDIYMARLVQRVIDRLGADWYRDMLNQVFGFGEKTGIELPSETAGMLPKPGKKYASGVLQWSAPTPYSLSFGYNLMVNSFQMMRNYAILANGGYDVKPTLIRKILKKDQVILDNTTPERVAGFKRLLDADIVAEVVRSMKYVTKPGGTASKGEIRGYTEVGKTGTAEKIIGGKYHKQTHFCSFIGFAPVKNPQFILLIAIDEPEYKYIPGIGKNYMGGNCAGPAFKEIGTRVLQYLGVEPDDPDNTDWLNEVRTLKLKYDEWNK